ncbi:MAG: hypothetical protein U0790_20440 [Isosphaeraceae bacterium]
MKTYSTILKRGATLMALVCLMGFAPENPPPPDHVEEDWTVVLASPDPLAVGPQITTVMSPNSDPASPFVTFYLNYRDHPTWQPGGLQVKVYGTPDDPAADPPVLGSDSQGAEVCQTTGETITWTQKLRISGGSLNYNIINGESSTWGKFGQGQGTLGVSATCSITDLGAYRPEYSASKSGVSWQSNRVTSMTLLAVRYYRGGNLISTDAAPRVVVAAAVE